LPWILSRLQNWSKLAAVISEIEIFMGLYNTATKYELKGYWLQIGNRVSVYSSYVNALKSLKGNPEFIAKAHLKIGRFLREMVEYSGAEELLLISLQLYSSFYPGQENKKIASVYYLLAELYWNQGKWDKAEPFCVRALEIREKIMGPNHLDVAMALVGLGEMQMRKSTYDEAQNMIKRALEIRISHFGPDHPLVARCLQDLAVIADNCGNSEQAIQLCTRALEVREKSLGPNHPHVATSLETLASIYKLKGDSSRAEPHIRRALEINLSIHGEYHPSVVSCYEWLALILKDLNRYDESVEVKQKADKLQEILGPVGERIAD